MIMMNRIDKKFSELKKNKKKALIAFMTAGDPSLKISEELVLSFEKAGVDIIELGVPFSDPMADGPTIQASSERALKNGVTLEKVLDLVQRIRRRTQIPIAFMMYYNPIFHMGEEKFIKRAKAVGLDGVIIPDLPPEEATNLSKLARKNNISTIFLLAPTTTKKRMKKIVNACSGFVYYVSLTGVTGVKDALPSECLNQIKSIKKITSKPVCIGFGIKTPKQAKQMAKCSDGIIVGSAIVKKIEAFGKNKDCVQKVSGFVKNLARVI